MTQQQIESKHNRDKELCTYLNNALTHAEIMRGIDFDRDNVADYEVAKHNFDLWFGKITSLMAGVEPTTKSEATDEAKTD
jgi:hypothetical protein